MIHVPGGGFTAGYMLGYNFRVRHMPYNMAPGPAPRYIISW